MSVVINTNFAATQAANNLATSNSSLQKSLNRLSSGSKIVNPADDAGGLAVAMKLSAAAKRSGAANTNIGNSISFLQTQDGALKVSAKVLDRMSELATLYTDPTKSSSDKDNYDLEFKALQSELKAITSEKFNTVTLFSATALSSQVSEDGQQVVSLTGKDLGNATSGVGTVTAATGLADTTNATLAAINTAIQNVATFRAQNGAEQSRLTFAGELLVVNKANLESASSRIMDVDVAEESTQLARWNVLVQSGTAMLSQANQSAQSVMKLLQ